VAGRYRREGGLKGGKRKRRLQGHLVQKKRKWFDLGIKVPKNGQWVNRKHFKRTKQKVSEPFRALLLFKKKKRASIK
jgi:hypothetical protein